jgi:hypothetical protein
MLKKSVLYATLTLPLGVEMRSRKLMDTTIQTEFDGESEKNNLFAPGELLFLTKYGS